MTLKNIQKALSIFNRIHEITGSKLLPAYHTAQCWLNKYMNPVKKSTKFSRDTLKFNNNYKVSMNGDHTLQIFQTKTVQSKCNKPIHTKHKRHDYSQCLNLVALDMVVANLN